MRNKTAALILTALIFATLTLTASAQIPLNMSYQARLADSTGNPVPDGPYDLEFNFYSDSTGGVPIWTEQFFGVNTNNGFFDVFLEMELDNLNAPLFMEVTVSGEILSPRTRMASVPYSAISHRVQGDIQTGEGFLRMNIPPDPYNPVAEIFSDENTNETSFKMSIPPDPVYPVIEMSADPVQSSFKLMDPVDEKEGFVALVSSSEHSMRLIDPVDENVAAVAISVDPAQSSFRMIDPVDKREGFVAITEASGNSIKLLNPDDDTTSAILMFAGPLQSSIKVIDPVDKREGFVLSTETSGNSMKLMDPGDDGVPVGEITAEPTQTSFKLMDPGDDGLGFEVLAGAAGNSIKMMDPGDDGITLIEMSGGVDGVATYKMFNPQPEPPSPEAAVEMKTMSHGGSYFTMNNLLGDVVGPLFEVSADPTGNTGLTIHAAEPTFASRVQVMAEYTDGASMTMFREGGTPHNEIKAMDLRVGSDIGGEFKIFDYSSNMEKEMLAISGSPSSGASLKMFNPQPEPPRAMVDIGATQLGASFAMAAPQAAGPGDQITDPMFEVTADSTGGAINIYDEIGKYMGLDPGPFTPGGYLYLIKSSGLAVDTNLTLGSDGYIRAENGVTIGPNTNSGFHTLVMGASTSASGDNSFAGGRHAQADHDNCFVWSEYPIGPSVVPLQTTTNNQFLVRATGGIAFYTNASMTYGVSLNADDYSWNSVMPPLTSRNSRDVDGADILYKIEQLPLKRYSADGENHHISPSPEEFNRLFDLGKTENQISAQDQSGIALAGIKEMINIINDLKDKNAELERRIAELERTR
jgi:hypothetical protein